MEQRITCQRCGTRLEEWDPKFGGHLHAYVPQTYTDPGCKAIEDAYDAARANLPKDEKGNPRSEFMNGVRVRLVPRETAQAQAEARRMIQELERRGTREPTERGHVPFYPFPD